LPKWPPSAKSAFAWRAKAFVNAADDQHQTMGGGEIDQDCRNTIAAGIFTRSQPFRG
jgi:hypothetical protein